MRAGTSTAAADATGPGARSGARTRSRSVFAAGVIASLLGAAAALVGSCSVFSGVTFTPPSDAATPGDAGEEASDGATDLPGLISLAEALQVCSKVLTCEHVAPSISTSFGLPIDATNFSQCVHTLSGPIDPARLNELTSERLRCIGKADGCAIAGCVPREEIDEGLKPAACAAEAGAAEKCIGDTRITCLRSVLKPGGWAFHCDDPAYAPGSRCVVQDGIAGCNVTTTACPANAQCLDGTQPLSVSDYCYDAGGPAPIHTKVDCAARGLKCQNSVPGCAATECGFHLQTQCEDPKKLSVCMFFQLAVLDCAAAGGTARCQAQNTSAYCAGPHEECTPYDPQPTDGKGVNSCDGTSIRLCVGGRMTSVDCRSAGPGYECRTGSVPKSNYCGPPG